MCNQFICDEAKLVQRMNKKVGTKFLTAEEVNALWVDLITLSKLFDNIFGLQITVTDKLPKARFTIDEKFLQAGIEQELREAGFLDDEQTTEG